MPKSKWQSLTVVPWGFTVARKVAEVWVTDDAPLVTRPPEVRSGAGVPAGSSSTCPICPGLLGEPQAVFRPRRDAGRFAARA